MKTKILITTIILFLAVFNSNAQDFRLGKVSIEELQEKVHPKDSSAVAAVLFEKAENKLVHRPGQRFEIELVVKTRIKIYKKEGYDWANNTFRYYLGSNLMENISFSEAVTYNLVDGEIEKTKLKSDGEFNEVINEYWGRKKITMPNVKEGSVIEYEYTLHSPNIGHPRDWYFQSDIPVNYSEYVNYVPENLVYNINIKGFIRPKVTVEKINKLVMINSDERVIGRTGELTTNFRNENVTYVETKTTYLAENVPAIKEEAFVNNIKNYTTILEQELSMIKYPNSMPTMFSTNWDAVVKTIYEYEDFGSELNKTGYFKDDLKTVLTGLSTQEEKIDAILKFIKSAVKWNGYYGYFCNDGVRKAYKDKIGNIAEINLMLTAMLRYAGLNANPVLVSTRLNGISFFPSRTAFNYVIAAVENGDDIILLDGSDPFSTPDVLPFRALNWFGRLIRKDGTSSLIDLMPKKVSMSLKAMNYSFNDKEGTITGKLIAQNTGHRAILFREEILGVKEDVYLEKLENNNNKIEINQYSRQNENEINLPVNETYSFSGNNLTESIGGKIYIDPLLFLTTRKNPFKQENREYPVDYGFPFLDKYLINIEIPEGYKIESLPQSLTLTMNENLGVFKYLSSLNGNIVQFLISNQINSSIVASENYADLKLYYQKMIEKQNEKIVLKKI